MPSIFKENDDGLRSIVLDTAFGSISGVTYLDVHCTQGKITDLSVVSTLDQEVQLFLQNGNPVTGTSTKHAWFKLSPNTSYSMQSTFAPQIYLPGRTHIWVKATGVAPGSGNLRFVMNGD